MHKAYDVLVCKPWYMGYAIISTCSTDLPNRSTCTHVCQNERECHGEVSKYLEAILSFSDYMYFLLGVLTSTAGIQTAINELRARNIPYSDSWFTNKTHLNFFDCVFGICIFIFYSYSTKKNCEAASRKWVKRVMKIWQKRKMKNEGNE